MNYAERLWGRRPTQTLQQLDRKQFSSDEEYLLAAARLEMERKTPEFQAAYSAVSREFKKQHEKERKERESAEYEQLMKTVKLSEYEQKRAMERASEAASSDLAAQRIFARDIAKKTEEYLAQFEAEERKGKVTNMMMDNALRRMAKNMNDE